MNDDIHRFPGLARKLRQSIVDDRLSAAPTFANAASSREHPSQGPRPQQDSNIADSLRATKRGQLLPLRWRNIEGPCQELKIVADFQWGRRSSGGQAADIGYGCGLTRRRWKRPYARTRRSAQTREGQVSGKLLGAAFAVAGLSSLAVAFAGLLTEFSTVPADPEALSYGAAETFGASGSNLFAVPNSAPTGDSRTVTRIADMSAQYASSQSVNYLLIDPYGDSLDMAPTISNAAPNLEAFRRREQSGGAHFLPGDAAENNNVVIRYPTASNYSGYFEIPPTMRSNINYSVPVEDPLYIAHRSSKANDHNIASKRNTRPNARVSKLATSPRALRPIRSPENSTRHPEAGCSRCVGRVAQAFSGRSKSLVALLSATVFRKVGAVPRRHFAGGNNQQRQNRMLAVRTFPRDWWNRAL